MGSKAIVYLGLVFAMVLLISSEVAARDLVETDTSTDAAVNHRGGGEYGGGGGNYGKGGGGGNYGGGGGKGGGGGNYGGGGGKGRGGGGGGRCRYGCCGRSYHGCRCCTFAGEKADADFQANPHN